MVRMTRLHLINWHNFRDDIIEFNNITYLLGVNAVGKTTIMDAVRYCLTTNKDFNTAGNKKSGRTLLGSVHQKQRAEDSYLRPGHTVSYIGIEFLDEGIGKTFVIIVRVESETPKQDLRGVYQDWYITKPGFSLEDIPFFTEVKSGRKPTPRDAFKLENKGMERAPSQAEARRRICRMLGIGEADSPLGKKFNEVFHMGTSLEDIKDIREFIYTYILPEPEVNIDFLQKDMRELERLQEVLQEAQDRENLLAEINERIVEARAKETKLKVNEMLVAYAKYQGNLEEQQAAQRVIDEGNVKVAILEDRLEDLGSKEKSALNLLCEAKQAAENNNDNQSLLSLRKEKENDEKAYEKYVSETKAFNKLTRQLADLRLNLSKNGFAVEWKDEIIQDAKFNKEERYAEIKKSQNSLKKVEDAIKDRESDLRVRLSEKQNTLSLLSEKKHLLESGIMCYPKEAVLVRDSINEALDSQSRKKDARLLCELLYMNDDSWQDAVESYLNTQRFNVIVSPENYETAKAVFVSLGDKVKNIGLVDTRRIRNAQKALEEGVKYLSQTVESENPYVKAYADYIMRGVVCADSADELERYSKSVTKDRLRYQNYCLQRMAKKEHFIGIDAVQKQLAAVKEELLKLTSDIEQLRNEKNHFSVVVNEYDKFIIGNNFAEIEKYCMSQSEAERTALRIDDLKNKIDELEKSPLLRAMFDRVADCKEKYNRVSEKITDVKAEIKNWDKKIQESDRTVSELRSNEEQIKQEYNSILYAYPEYAGEVEKRYSGERKTKKASQIAYKFNNHVTQDNIALNNYMNQNLIPLQQKYTATYTCDFPEGIVGAEKYQQEYTTLQNIELERHKESLKSAQERCKDRFRKEVLFRMKNDILGAKQQFRQINRAMEKLKYGEESYRFDIDKSKDKELGMFYDIIMDKENRQIEQEEEMLSLFSEENKSEVFESQIEEFMGRIMIDVENHAKENITGHKTGAKSIGNYIDYRTYLDYDIIVKNFVTGNEVPLSKVSGEGSGGENQAPFYVAICASLLQIYEQNPDGCIRLVLLDEAFNNMTSDRIEPMMNMFKTLNLQLVLIATAEKATSIFPYCDVTYSIVKSGNRNAIRKFERI